MRVLGIDLGSREVKIVVTESGEITRQFKISTMKFYRDFCENKDGLVFQANTILDGKFDKMISTGYGRNHLSIKSFTPINEVKAHVYGVLKKSEYRDFIMLDIGGQDVKVVKVENGIITDINLNDKCAASCGRYLENMAAVLETTLDEISMHHKDPVILNSTCSVFSESELIGKIAEGCTFPSLCAGINFSLYNKIKPLLTGFTGKDLIISGGVSENGALLEYLKKDYKKIIKIKDPQYNGAAGCCYYGERI